MLMGIEGAKEFIAVEVVVLALVGWIDGFHVWFLVLCIFHIFSVFLYLLFSISGSEYSDSLVSIANLLFVSVQSH